MCTRGSGEVCGALADVAYHAILAVAAAYFGFVASTREHAAAARP
jgi:hypothetical protein